MKAITRNRCCASFAVLVVGTLILPVAAQAQTATKVIWSPLEWRTDLPRTLPQAPVLPDLLTAPDPLVGMHWTAGNPAGLPFETDSDRASIGAGFRNERGDYHRPLDAGSVRSGVADGGGWRRIGPGAVSGGLSVERTEYADGIYGNLMTPYASSPHTSADSSGAEIREFRARLDGAGGWRIGSWSVGLALGYETTDARTEATLTPRFRRSGAGAATVGFARAFRDGDAIIGVYARASADAQRLVVSAPRGEVARVYAIEGLGQPVAIDFATGAYNRRIERNGYGIGGTASLRALGTHFIAWGGYSHLTERQIGEIRRGAPEDRFEPGGMSGGIAAQRRFSSGGQVTLNVSYRSLRGDAMRAVFAAEGVLFRVEERQLNSSVQLRWQSDSWQAAVLGGLQHEARTRFDLLERTGSDISAWRPQGSIEAARSFGSLAIGMGAGISSYGPTGSVPGLEGHSGAYERFIAPELTLRSTPALGYSVAGSARYQTGGGRQLWARVGHSSVAPRVGTVSLPFDPAGSRSVWTITLGIVLGNSLSGASVESE